MPGSSDISARMMPTLRTVRPLFMTWSPISWPRACSLAPLVTRMPAEVETSSAGICATRPSPIVRMVYFSNAWSSDRSP